MSEQAPDNWPDYSQTIPEFLKEALAIGIITLAKVAYAALTQETKDKI